MNGQGVMRTYTMDELAMKLQTIPDYDDIDDLGRYFKVQKVFNATTNDIALSKEIRQCLYNLTLYLTLAHEGATSIEFYTDEDTMLGTYDTEWNNLLWYSK
jgi:hypothetical protein